MESLLLLFAQQPEEANVIGRPEIDLSYRKQSLMEAHSTNPECVGAQRVEST